MELELSLNLRMGTYQYVECFLHQVVLIAKQPGSMLLEEIMFHNFSTS